MTSNADIFKAIPIMKSAEKNYHQIHLAGNSLRLEHDYMIFFLERAGELRVVVLIGRKNGPITMPNPRPGLVLCYNRAS